jgi:cytochrome c553
MRKLCSLFVLLALGVEAQEKAPPPDKSFGSATPGLAQDKEGAAFFEAKIRPVLIERCYSCHSAEAKKLKAELYVDSREGLLKGGETGPAVIPGDLEKSLLIKAIRYKDEDLKMPPKGKLTPEVVADFEAWVKRGAPDPRAKGAAAAKKEINIEAGKKYWAFQPLQTPAVPAVKQKTRTPVDAFIAAKLEAAGIRPNPEADKRRLIRRATFDLLGLPPTSNEVDAFLADTDPDAFSKVVDGLLARSEFGEKWARHWLDIARFAESHGFEQDYDRENAYHYRDFVIKAFNSNLPYDKFVQWQVAGDELAPDEPLAWMATGFLGAGAFPTQLTETEFESARYDELDSMASTTSSAFLGLSIGCARCHDHKFDPFPSRDYYRIASTFTTAIRAMAELHLDPEGDKAALATWEKEHPPLVAALEKFEKEELPGRFEHWAAGRNRSRSSGRSST